MVFRDFRDLTNIAIAVVFAILLIVSTLTTFSMPEIRYCNDTNETSAQELSFGFELKVLNGHPCENLFDENDNEEASNKSDVTFSIQQVSG